MPKSTFYKLPEEKKQRILDAARQEFSKVPFREASINHIIKMAGIPRGSFYQYFEDKQDLYFYFIHTHEKTILDMFLKRLKQCKGDIFACLEYFLNVAFSERAKEDIRSLQILFSEPMMFELFIHKTEKGKDCVCQDKLQKMMQEIDMELLCVENEEEVLLLLSILENVLCQGFGKLLLQKENLTNNQKEKEIMMKKLHFLKKRYCRAE